MISKEEVDNLATLARLELSDAEKASLAKDISNILEYVGQVSAVAMSDGRPAVPLQRNVMRDDTPRAAGNVLLGKEESLRASFPKREGNYNVVRKIIQKDE
jgi:aspartyl-tRNA(Asn)/glutamyl-tRNA(Gln) amidotransferase subunit C